jgi:hypothetical protein
MYKNYEKFSLSENYDSRTGLTKIDGLYNHNGKEKLFTEIIKGHPSYNDIHEELEHDFLTSKIEYHNKPYMNEYEMIRLNKKKHRSTKRKRSQNKKRLKKTRNK